MSYKNLVWNNSLCIIFILIINLPLCLLIQIWINPFWPPCVVAFSKIIFLKAVWNIFWLKFTPKMRTNCYLSIDIYMSFLKCTNANDYQNLLLLTWFFFRSPKPNSKSPSRQENKNCPLSYCPHKYSLSVAGFYDQYMLRYPMNMKLFCIGCLKNELNSKLAVHIRNIK